MRKLKYILIILGVLLLTGAVFVYISSSPLTEDQADKKIESHLVGILKDDHITEGLVYVYSKKKNFEKYYAVGANDPNQPFHVASVGKTFTATIIAKLHDEGKLSLDDPIKEHLTISLDGLFLDSDNVTVRQLLNHTSGIADYFLDETNGSDSLISLVINEPNRYWTPEDLVSFSRDYQKPIGKPNEQYHYSDTGYILLGLIIEDVTDMSFDDALNHYIFEPLEMKDSYLMFSEDIREPIADIWLNEVNVKDYNSLSIDWSGGGIISTLDDLKTFVKALYDGKLVTDETLNEMTNFDQKFGTGMYYGLGMIEYKFTEFFPTLDFLPPLKGHMGVLGTQMVYDPESETVFICSFGSTNYTEGSVKTMIQILSYIERIN